MCKPDIVLYVLVILIINCFFFFFYSFANTLTVSCCLTLLFEVCYSPPTCSATNF